MAEIMAWPLNLTAYSYNAQDVMRFMAGKTSGIFGEEGNFQVIAKSGMTITVQAEGMTGGWLSDGAKYGISFWSANDIDLTVETADGVNPRKDRVVVSWHIPQQATVPDVVIRKGTPSASPQPPALVNNGEHAEICLAEINVPAGATEITSYNITDTRLDETLCGLVSMGVKKIPTDGLEAQFMDWFEDLQTNLDGDVAVNLQNQITGHVSDTEVHLRTLTHSKYGTTHNLAGVSGVSGTVSCVFKATSSYSAGDSIRVDGSSYTIQLSNGETAEDNLFVSGAAVPVVLDTAGKKVNFKPAGGAKLPAETLAIVKIFTENGTFTVPQTGNYRVTVIGTGGKGGKAAYSSGTYYGAGGGGAGGAAQSLLSLAKGEEYTVTVDSAQSSFGSLLSAVKGGDGTTRGYGSGGTSSGGSEFSLTGGRGYSGGSVSSAQYDVPGGDGGYYINAETYDPRLLVGSAPENGGISPLSGLPPYKPTAYGFPPYGVGGGGGSRFGYQDGYAAFLNGGPGGLGAVIIELVL